MEMPVYTVKQRTVKVIETSVSNDGEDDDDMKEKY